MGGMGSGRWGWHDKKTVVENCRSIDVNKWQRGGWLKPGRSFASIWGQGTGNESSICIAVEEEGIELSYKMTRTGKNLKYFVPITWTPCYYGGRRPWFLCPNCGRRAAKLYLRWERFLCRSCNRLSYECQRESLMDRLIRRCGKRKERLGGGPAFIDPFPEKPKGMRFMTWLRLAIDDRNDTMKICSLLHEENQASLKWIRRHRREDSP